MGTTETQDDSSVTTSVAVSRKASNLLDEMVASIRPRPTKVAMLDMIIEQEAERRGIRPESESAA